MLKKRFVLCRNAEKKKELIHRHSPIIEFENTGQPQLLKALLQLLFCLSENTFSATDDSIVKMNHSLCLYFPSSETIAKAMTSVDKTTKTIKSLVLFFNALFFVSLRAPMRGQIFITILDELQLSNH